MKKRLLAGITLLLIGVFYLKVLSPQFNIHIPCVFNKLTGYECPGCGMTRAALALLDGDVYQSFRYNMLPFLLAPLYASYTIFEKKKWTKQSKGLMMIMLGLTILFFILRNTETFHWLAPTIVR